MAEADSTQPEGWALIVDDHPLFCDALVLTLQSLADYPAIRTADCLEAALAVLTAADTAPSLVVLDLNLPDVHGLDGLFRLQERLPDTPLIVVSSLTEKSVIDAVFTAGASGYVPKHSPRTVIAEALGAARAGRFFAPEGYSEPDGDSGLADAGRRLAGLTGQQRRILSLICDGKLNKQIAYELSISEATVKAHVTAILRKLGAQSRTQAVLVAQRARIDGSLQSGGPGA